MPRGRLPPDVNWVCGTKDQFPQGMICVNRREFLESKILAMLEAINRKTTVVPNFSGVHNGEWFLELTTWAEHHRLSSSKCLWKENAPTISGDNDNLNFSWRYRDEWRYEHEGDHGGCGLYTVKCMSPFYSLIIGLIYCNPEGRTNNKLSIPTNRGITRSDCSITMNGKVDLELEYAGGSKGSEKKWRYDI
jgi:hypothetical protein